jgi:hypothetical protein
MGLGVILRAGEQTLDLVQQPDGTSIGAPSATEVHNESDVLLAEFLDRRARRTRCSRLEGDADRNRYRHERKQLANHGGEEKPSSNAVHSLGAA